MKVTVLGCGGSGGVPLPGGTPGGYWGDCDPGNPRNRRRRVSILVETRGRAILIDTSPDLRAQLLDNAVGTVDAVLFTHAHADHVHGLDDLRPLVYGRKRPIPAYMTEDVRETLTRRFDYAFTSSHAHSELYPALMEDRAIAHGAFDIEGVPATAFRQDHGNIDSTGFRIGPVAYSTDVVDLDETAFAALAGVELWIVDCLRFDPHPTHTHFARTLGWIEKLRPGHAVLTHMNHTTDYEALKAQCPPGVEPAYDGMVIELPED